LGKRFPVKTNKIMFHLPFLDPIHPQLQKIDDVTKKCTIIKIKMRYLKINHSANFFLYLLTPALNSPGNFNLQGVVFFILFFLTLLSRSRRIKKHFLLTHIFENYKTNHTLHAVPCFCLNVSFLTRVVCQSALFPTKISTLAKVTTP